MAENVSADVQEVYNAKAYLEELYQAVVVLSVLRFTTSDCPFGIFKFYLYSQKIPTQYIS
jgi:hypothetical protein